MEDAEQGRPSIHRHPQKAPPLPQNSPIKPSRKH